MSRKDLINDKIKYFCDTIRKVIPSNNLVLFNKNISTFKVEYSYYLYERIVNRRIVSGEYLPVSNVIILNRNVKIAALIHELLHMASTRCIGKDKVLSGFSVQYRDNDNFFDIGLGLTEGYTEILRNRYFEFDEKEDLSEYHLQQYFSLLIEKIIGKEKMENSYFNADISSFYTELANYSDLDDIIRFMTGLDDVTFSNDKSKVLDAFNYIYRFVIDCYLNKEYKSDEEKEEFLKMLFLFPKEFEYRGICYTVDVEKIYREECNKNKMKKKIFCEN